ncbi:thiamine phosphate synthase [Mesorhizobium sp. M4A.F.Ca.ET.022.05.2.1]|uniref:thiamine phosphate synthase n=2 Tax=unclassified Mesorhizobium TaxID=325217 RepID=UPI000FCA2EE7|nr:thiamine phosphate synthase [Mesorhizobium sp. M4A.F.Ca.ET.022.05.2.1]RVC82079.1 thiamine phosphate synthase [Mesorhizobium sp. M4A.F.Ca.ET.022.05.2.1]RVD69902.1 thiamine phosphate synthase [Mesorhizobium sp. M4A.F.Ca.ET.029.04.2.1]
MNDATPPNRCRIVLIAPKDAPGERIAAAFEGGDVASLILPENGMDDVAFQAFAERIVPTAQAAGIAVVIAGDTRIAGRVQADGIHVEVSSQELAETIEHFQGRMMVGVGGAKTRDDALALGEARPDYIFFGRFGYDNKPEPHPRNLSLGQWWAEMIQIPCIVMAGSDLASVEAVAATGAEFVALSSAVFADGIDPRGAIAAANALLDETAPRFED